MSEYIWILSALLGALFGFLISYWRTKYLVRAKEFSDAIVEVCDQVNRLEELACRYWEGHRESEQSLDYIVGHQQKLKILLGYLESAFGGVLSFEVAKSSGKFYEACTGDDFGSATVEIDPSRQRRILATGESLKVALRKARVSKM